jgi:predicted Zn-dependent peptidase
MNRTTLFLIGMLIASPGASGQEIEVEEFTLDNGMTFLLLPRDEQPNTIAAGWLANVGSVNERPGITGISHFFEHMMYKGTSTIGTNDAERDGELRIQQDAVKNRINDLIWNGQYERFRRGEIDDPWDPAHDTDEIKTLRASLRDLQDQHKAVIVESEFDRLYMNEGTSGPNAFTSHEITFYILNLPSNKFELWAWMESDRLIDSVFREFYAERDMVHEERRLNVESTPTGVFQEQFDAMFWQSSPYSWPVIGWPSDLNSYTLEQAQEYFDVYYQPSNLVGVIVGDFDPDVVKPIIRRYFDRLQPGDRPVPPVVTTEVPQLAEKRMVAACECQPQVEVRYHTVPFGHADSYALELMAEVLNGRTGRLYKALVEELDIASSVSASAGGFGDPSKYAGQFSFQAEVKGEADPLDLEAAWYRELETLKQLPIEDEELQRVKNRVAVDAFRNLQDNFFLMIQLGLYESLGSWEHINTRPRKLQAVTSADVRRVARKYFNETNRTVGIYRRQEFSVTADPELMALHPLQRQQAVLLLEQMQGYPLDSMQRARARLLEQKDQVPEDQRVEVYPMVDYLLKKIDERIAELQMTEGGSNP